MKKIIVHYYLPTFLGLFVMFCLYTFTGESVHSLLGGIFIAFAFALVTSLIVGTLYYFIDTKWGPKKAVSLLSKTPFKQLKEHGFRQEDDFVWGVVIGYTVFVSFAWHSGKPAINIDVLFDPKSLGRFLTQQELRELGKRHKMANFWHGKEYTWDRNAVGYLMEYTFRPPSYENVIAEAATLTEILMKENLKPMSKEETSAMLPELREWIAANN